MDSSIETSRSRLAPSEGGILRSQVSRHRYRLVAALAHGGMGEVYVGQALDRPGEPFVAIKTLLPEVAQDAEMLSRFLDEARISARLDHPNIAKLLDFGEADGRPFAVFELLEGFDLAASLTVLNRRQARVPFEVAALLVAGAARGLHYAHTLTHDGLPLEVVHRDLSPGNLLLTSQGMVKVLDFGAATGRDRVTRTATGLVIGKVEYMAPEQVKGDRISARTDVFALGLCLYELLAGRRPYLGLDEREKARRIFAADIPSLAERRADVTAPLLDAIVRATKVNPAERFANAQELAETLESFTWSQTNAPGQEVLRRFFFDCFGAERLQIRSRRLNELAAEARDRPPGEVFSWEAPSLGKSKPTDAMPAIPKRADATAGARPKAKLEPKPAREIEPNAAAKSASDAAAEADTDKDEDVRALRPTVPVAAVGSKEKREPQPAEVRPSPVATPTPTPKASPVSAPNPSPSPSPNPSPNPNSRRLYVLFAVVVLVALGLGVVLGKVLAGH